MSIAPLGSALPAASTPNHDFHPIPAEPTTAPVHELTPAPHRSSRALADSGLRTFPIGLRLPTEPSEAPEARLLDRFTAQGGQLLEVDEGRGQAITGAWLRRRGIRDRLLLSCTVDATPPMFRRATPAEQTVTPGLIGSTIRRQLEAALRRLQTDCIDLVHLRLHPGDDALDEALLALDEQLRGGRIRAIGGSGTAVQRLVEARVASGQLSVARMVSLRHPYSLTERRGYEQQAATVVEHLGLGALPRVQSAAAAGNRRGQRRRDRLEAALAELAAQTGAEASAIALAWLLSKPNVVAPVVTPVDEVQLDAAMQAVELELSRGQLTELERLSSLLPVPARGHSPSRRAAGRGRG